jgi:hypothetical protein
MLFHLFSKNIITLLKTLIMPIPIIICLQIGKLLLDGSRNRIKMRKSILHIFLTVILHHLRIHRIDMIENTVNGYLPIAYIMKNNTREHFDNLYQLFFVDTIFFNHYST